MMNSPSTHQIVFGVIIQYTAQELPISFHCLSTTSSGNFKNIFLSLERITLSTRQNESINQQTRFPSKRYYRGFGLVDITIDAFESSPQ